MHIQSWQKLTVEASFYFLLSYNFFHFLIDWEKLLHVILPASDSLRGLEAIVKKQKIMVDVKNNIEQYFGISDYMTGETFFWKPSILPKMFIHLEEMFRSP